MAPVIAPPKPPPTDPEALIPEARDRQRRRRLIVVSTIALASGLTVALYSIVGGGSSSATARSRNSPSGAPPCRSSQLTTMYGGFGLVPGDTRDVGALVLKNAGPPACSLPGTPRVGVYSGGRRLVVRQLPANRGVPNSRGPLARTLGPGKTAWVSFLWSNWCGSTPNAPATFRYDFGRGLVLSQRWARPTCTAPRKPSTLRVAGPLATHQ
jgi:hypothetical protein